MRIDLRAASSVVVTTCVLFPATLRSAPADDAGALKPIFDGKSLSGWTVVGVGEFSVANGEIHAKSARKSFLRTEKTYGDFVLELELNVETGGNSGVQFRSHVTDKGRVYGYQAEVDTSERAWAGGLYDEGRRKWLHPLEGLPKAQAAFRNGEWNKYKIRCFGDSIQIWVNDVLTTDYRDSMDLEGYIALQHHGEKEKLYRFRNIRLQDLGVSRWRPLFDGKTLEGWESNGHGSWTVADGAVVGRSKKSEPNHGLLFSDREFDDFTIRLKYRSIEGNSGFYFRVDKDKRGGGCAGFQAEIDPVKDAGGLYETYGRAWVVQPKPEDVKKYFKPGEWNEMTVSAHGTRVVVHVNGYKSAELQDDKKGRRKGYLALQLHGGADMHVEFEKIEIVAK